MQKMNVYELFILRFRTDQSYFKSIFIFSIIFSLTWHSMSFNFWADMNYFLNEMVEKNVKQNLHFFNSFLYFLILFPVIMPNGNLFLGQHIFSKEILKRISFNDLTLLYDVDLKRSLLSFSNCFHSLLYFPFRNENTSKIFCLKQTEIKYAPNVFVYALKWSVGWEKFWYKAILQKMEWKSLLLIRMEWYDF